MGWHSSGNLMEKIWLKIHNCQSDGIETEETEVLCEGRIEREEEALLFLYHLKQESGELACELVLRSSAYGKRVEIYNHGAIESCLIFEAGVRKVAHYRTAYGRLPMEVETDFLEISESEKEWEIRMKYRLFSMHQLVTENEVDIQIRTEI